ncbi:MAG: glycoside hydrolase family 92 protein [Chitinophagaceae bacterium]|nr:MAG: glycoside hydrolase family 92 protein [Chitinophagaceae bacterium]
MKFSKAFSILFFIIFLFNAGFAQTKNYAALVNPFIGTGGHGHTYPGASMPFGMMQLSPDTRLEGWDGCSGYHYSDSLIYGFSHTHLSGTGIADYCDVLLMPFTGDVKWNNKEYASPFSHKNEKAHAGFYEVLLDKYNIKASLTTSVRSGMHQYQFAADATEGKVLIDLAHRDQVLESSLEIVNDYEVRGMRRSKSWATNQVIYFYLKFEQPIIHSELQAAGKSNNDSLQVGKNEASGKMLKAAFKFDLKSNKILNVKIGISGVSMENAHTNLDTEIPGWDFNLVKANAEAAWNKELSKIEVTGGTKDEQTVFYTALYHASLNPNIYTDVNGDYRGTDKQVHKANGFTNYTVFSLWDTYRALHPLMNIINKKRSNDWINTFLVQYKYGGMLPVWELSGNETFCMIGYHSIPVIVDAYRKGIIDYDKELALKAMMDFAESNRFGLTAYQNKGFISNDEDHESASKTMEYAYDDWCIAQFAWRMGKEEVYKKYLERSLYYRNLFDPSTGHIRGKVQGFWFSPFKAGEVNNFFTEGNSWHYSFAAPHDINGLAKLYGGLEKFAAKADELFTTKEPLSGRDQADVTGLIGQYAQGNEPSHHMAYLFNYVGKPWRTQELISKINKEFYLNAPDGLIGNEDCGQMSAWHIFSAMGFYPVTPASGSYALGTPVFDEVKMHLENGKTFTITAKNLSKNNFYVKSMQLNGAAHTSTFIKDDDFANGGSMVFEMSSEPNKQRGTKPGEMPIAEVDDAAFVPVPYFEMPSNKIKESITVVLKNIDKDAGIYYSIQEQGGKASAFIKYAKPFSLNNAATVKYYAEKRGNKSKEASQQFYKVVTDRTITIKSKVHPMYTAGGPDALIDGIVGTSNWKTGEWQSYYDQDFEAVVEFKQPKKITYIGAHVLQDVSPWILFPSQIDIAISKDGKNFEPILTKAKENAVEDKPAIVQTLGGEVSTTAKYVRIKLKSGGKLPAWHESAGYPSHLFIDEIIIK